MKRGTINTNHTGYSGTGFVEGFWKQGTATTFSVKRRSSDAIIFIRNKKRLIKGDKIC
ncbi:hypothetical protein QA584_13835 [Anaerocolumna sp. AGMB13025]|uniref:hypothetical protein n=1 Tax=Anaerocolumna sp. AGMB13025 TaxID=3039116 RepID=UPI00241D6C5F|nr:hypothetical protein [Anaerocolumna sp. AGMB13025]WFR60111.1 hypothetical protein QA584_13835 [Anaerocolumna sp. AGMB13025]